jgi:hypothetical protein
MVLLKIKTKIGIVITIFVTIIGKLMNNDPHQS